VSSGSRRVAAVAGGAGGIGRAVCQALARAGYAVGVLDRDLAGARQVSELIGADSALAVDCDVCVREACDHALSALEPLGDLDVVVMAAGTTVSGDLRSGDPARWREVYEVNVLGTMHLAQAALGRLAPRGTGHIVVVASLSGTVAYTGEPIYLSSKWAQLGFTRALRQEARTYGVAVTTVLPGLVDTPLSRGNDAAERLFSEIGEPLQPEDVAAAVVWSLSQPARVNVGEILLRPLQQAL